MLRHATGFYLANAGQDTRAIQLYLGHKNIQHTVGYTELSTQRFKDFGAIDLCGDTIATSSLARMLERPPSGNLMIESPAVARKNPTLKRQNNVGAAFEGRFWPPLTQQERQNVRPPIRLFLFSRRVRHYLTPILTWSDRPRSNTVCSSSRLRFSPCTPATFKLKFTPR
jgi:Phage integrase family